MTLEETKQELETLISGNQYSLHQVEIHTLQSALQHLEAGKRLREAVENLRDQKGRHNTGIAYDELMAILESTTTKEGEQSA